MFRVGTALLDDAEANRKLAVVLDGVYRRGEIYLRWMQRLSSLASGVGFWLSFPMLFFMGAASHYAMFGGR